MNALDPRIAAVLDGGAATASSDALRNLVQDLDRNHDVSGDSQSRETENRCGHSKYAFAAFEAAADAPDCADRADQQQYQKHPEEHRRYAVGQQMELITHGTWLMQQPVRIPCGCQPPGPRTRP